MPVSNRMMRPRYNTRRGIDSRPGPGGRMGGRGFGGRGGRGFGGRGGMGRGRGGRGGMWGGMGRGNYRGRPPGQRPNYAGGGRGGFGMGQQMQQQQQQGGGRGSFPRFRNQQGMGQQMQQFQQQQQAGRMGRTMLPVGGQGGQNPGFGQGLPNQNQTFSPLQRPAQEPYANMQQQAARMGQQEPLGQPLGSGLPQGGGGQVGPHHREAFAQSQLAGRGNIQGTLAGVQGGPMNQYRPGQNFNQRIQRLGARRANPIMGGANPQAMANMQRARGQFNMSR